MLTTLFFTSAISAYEIGIVNQTDTDMKVEMEFGASSICSDETWVIKARSRIDKEVGLCCALPMKFEGVGGNLTKQTFTYKPPRTGAGLSCMSFEAAARPLGYNSYYVETIKPGT